MKRYYIVEGDKTTANGIVQKHTSGASTTSWQGKIISNIGDKVSCPKCKSIGIIQAVGQRKPFGNQGNRTIKTYQTTTVREKTYFAKPAFYNV